MHVLLHGRVWESEGALVFIPRMGWQEWSWGPSVLAAEPTGSKLEDEG